MIIQVAANLAEDGYVENEGHLTAAPFFACANVAFRREALEEIGPFDPKCVTGEDLDVCVRLSETAWRMAMRRDAIVEHRNPSSLRRLVRQWYGYGRYHPYVFAKHNDTAVELYVRQGDGSGGPRFRCLMWRPFPVSIIVFFSRLLPFVAAVLATIVLALFGLGTATAVTGGVALLAAFVYAWPDLRRSGPIRGLAFAAVRLIADSALAWGALRGGISQRMIYVVASVE